VAPCQPGAALRDFCKASRFQGTWNQEGRVAPVHAKTNRELRTFAVVIAVPLAALAVWLAWRGRPAWTIPAGVAGLVVVLGLFAPRLLALPERLWMKLANLLAVVMTHVLLVSTFYLLITPIGLLSRVFGKRPVTTEPDASAASYWEPVEADPPYARPDKPY
ncbi:MAG: SxtJ family membrane protein, partial [Acidobacteriota bacterium]